MTQQVAGAQALNAPDAGRMSNVDAPAGRLSYEGKRPPRLGFLTGSVAYSAEKKKVERLAEPPLERML